MGKIVTKLKNFETGTKLNGRTYTCEDIKCRNLGKCAGKPESDCFGVIMLRCFLFQEWFGCENFRQTSARINPVTRNLVMKFEVTNAGIRAAGEARQKLR